MPMYEFACQSCGHPFEMKLRMSQVGEPQPCPNCNGLQTRRRISSAAAIGGVGRVDTAVSGPPPNSPFT